ncbi:MAG: U32 family peptidase [Desulfuromonas sp.]|nr:U32 family peptidase [Desulfuromonas sp.]
MNQKKQAQRVNSAELLAPAGSLEAFFAAMEAGADAVYCGLQSFSARAKAKNFSLSDLSDMTAYAHQRQRKLFVTMNTLVKEAELPELIDSIAAVEQAGVDALILQDLGVWRLAREYFPQLALHSSTQMTVHNSAGVKQLEKMGFERAVLARELTLAEISHIRSQTQIELEHFIHGALCFCFSGQCYFSSYLGGKSGNRGRCTQPCRRRYSYRGKNGYYFSPNDLSAIELLPELLEAGISSFKIEGRMKSAEYVSNVVSAYRQMMDAKPQQRPEVLKMARALLKQSYGRTPTKGFLAGAQPADMATPALRGSTGRYLGEVTRVSGNKLSFNSRDSLHVGDRIRIQPGSDKVGTAFTLKQLWSGARAVKKMAAGPVCVSNPFGEKFKTGDAVFKVSSQQAFSLSDAACRRKLTQVKPRSQGLALDVSLHDDQLHIRAQVGTIELQSSYPVEVYAAQNSPLSQQTLEQVFKHTAQEPFELQHLQANDLPNVVVPPKQLKAIRRELYERLSVAVQRQDKQQRTEQINRAKAALAPVVAHSRRSSELTVGVRDLREMRVLDQADVDRVLVPLSAAVLHRRWHANPRQQHGVVWDVPFVIFDHEWRSIQQAIHYLVEAGFIHFRLNNISHFALFNKHSNLCLETGYRLFCMNTQALRSWQELGACSSELYIEDERGNMTQVLARAGEYPVRAVVYTSVALITSRIRIPSVKSDAPLVSDRGDEYRVTNRGGVTVLQSQTDFSLCDQMGQLQDMGCAGYLVDISHLSAFSQEGQRVLEAARGRATLAQTSQFNFFSGIE